MNFLILLALAVLLSTEPVICPDLATAIQSGFCPDAARQRKIYETHCSSPRTQPDALCDRYEKDGIILSDALWYSADKEFNGFVSCNRNLTPEKVRAKKPEGVYVGERSSFGVWVMCKYGDDIEFGYSTKAWCFVPGDGTCPEGSGVCSARCFGGDPAPGLRLRN